MKMIKYVPEPFSCRCSSDYCVPPRRELLEYFPRSRVRYHKNDPAMYALADSVIAGLGHGQLLTHPSISRQNIDKFRVEIAVMLAHAMAYGLAAPQRCGGQSRNAVVSALTKYIKRIYRFAGGHGIQLPSGQFLGKKKYGYLINDIMDNGWLWDYAEMCNRFYKRKLARGQCEEI